MPIGVYVRTDEHRKNISGENNPMFGITGENHPSFGKHHTEESKKKMRENHADVSGENNPNFGRTGENHPMFGKHHKEESKKKMSGENNPMFGKSPSYETQLKRAETILGGFWIGNIVYPGYIACELWNDVNRRAHLFNKIIYGGRCMVCSAIIDDREHSGHHVFYEKMACCIMTEEGDYYSNLNARDHPVKDYYIGKNPNYFAILCTSCHGKTNGGFENRKMWADKLRKIIDEEYGGKCYFTREEEAIYL